MRKVYSLFQIVAFACVFAFPVSADETESRPSLKRLINESRDFGFPVTASPSGVPPIMGRFHAGTVRKKIFGDESTFLRQVAALLQTGENGDVDDALDLILGLEIDEESVFKILRERFASSDHLLQYRICSILARHPSKENIDFLIEALEQSEGIRADVAYFLSYFPFEIGYFGRLDAEQKDRILNAFLLLLDDEREIRDRDGTTSKVSDNIASLFGYFGNFAKPALSKIREKFISARDGTDYDSIANKLRLAWAIVRIAPEQSGNELEYILQKAVKDKSKEIRCEAIDLLKTVPASLAERVIPSLCTIVQNETRFWNKIRAAEAINAILLEQESLLIDPFDESYSEENGDGGETG